jgi:hypothetical protein
MVRLVVSFFLAAVVFFVFGVRSLLDHESPVEGFVIGALFAASGGLMWALLRRRRRR